MYYTRTYVVVLLSVLNHFLFCLCCSSLRPDVLPRAFPFKAEALALHEGIPGHHTQTMLAGENVNLPHFRRFMDDRRYSEAPARLVVYDCIGVADILGVWIY